MVFGGVLVPDDVREGLEGASDGRLRIWMERWGRGEEVARRTGEGEWVFLRVSAGRRGAAGREREREQ
jgi:hypothetical protein